MGRCCLQRLLINMLAKRTLHEKPLILLLVGVLAVSTAAILIKLALPHASPLAISFYRLLFSSIIAFVIYRSRRSRPEVSLSKSNIFLMILGGVFLALHFTSWTCSLDMLSVSSSVIFVTTTPLWVGLLSPLIFKEKVPSKFYLGVGLAILGGILIATLSTGETNVNGQESSLLGLFLALVGAWMASAYFIIGKKLTGALPTELYVTTVYSVATIVLGLFLAVEQRGTLAVYQPATYGLLLLMAVIPQTLGHTSFNLALNALSARTVSLSLLFEPVGSTILAIFLLKEIPSAVEVAGGILILTGLVVALKTSPNVG
ncbi:MAG: DMT family transporter [Chloroflexi bacterium]|nr:DMT family transporter [Chloroflexota bacterium]